MKQRLRVAMSLLSHAPQMTGAATYARDLIRALDERSDEVGVEVLCNEHALARLAGCAENGVRLRQARHFKAGRTPYARAAAMLGIAAMPGRITRQLTTDPQVIHYPLSVGLPRIDLPTVVSLHDTQHLDLPQQWPMAGRAWRWAAYHRVARAATAVVTGSQYAKKRITELLEIASERVVVVHYGIDHRRFSPAADDDDLLLRRRLKLPERFVYYPAGLWPHKNHLRLIEAFALVEDRRLHLVLTGALTGRLTQIVERASRLRIGDRVHHCGFLADADLPGLYRAAEAVVFPSLYEGFGLPPLEAMACGCPVASSRRAALAEVCADAAAVLEPDDVGQMADTIASIVADEQLRDSLRERGIARASRFSWSAAAAAHLVVYSSAAAGRPPAPGVLDGGRSIRRR